MLFPLQDMLSDRYGIMKVKSQISFGTSDHFYTNEFIEC